MATPASSTSYKLLKQLWPQKAIYEQMLADNPTLGILRKDTKFFEVRRNINVGGGGPSGIGPDLATAKFTKGPSKAKEFQIDPVSMYGSFSIAGRLERIAEGGDRSVIVDPMARESRNMLRRLKQFLGVWIHGNGVGAIGQISGGSTVSSTQITLADTTKGRNFEDGLYLMSSSGNTTTSTLRAGYVQISSADDSPQTGTVTATAAWNVGIPSVATSDYLYLYGFFNNVVSGFDAWNPASAPGGGDSFFGVDRSASPRKYAGLRLSYTGKSVREAMTKTAQVLADYNNDPDTCVLNTEDYTNLTLELQSAGLFTKTQMPAAPIGDMKFGIAYDALEFQGPRKKIQVIADPDAPLGVGRMFMRESCLLASTGELFHWIRGASPDQPMMEDQADSRECRMVADLQFYNEAPGSMARFTF